MKGTNKNSGFSRKYLGDRVLVKFDEYNGKVVVCTIEDDFTCEVFKGRAKLHPDDKFDRIDGRSRAYARAITKRREFYNKMLYTDTQNIVRRRDEIEAAIDYRFEKLCEKTKALETKYV